MADPQVDLPVDLPVDLLVDQPVDPQEAEEAGFGPEPESGSQAAFFFESFFQWLLRSSCRRPL